MDHFVDIPIIRLETNISGVVADWLGVLAQELPLHDLYDLVALGEQDDAGKRAFAIRGLAAIAEECQADVMRVFKRCIFDQNQEFRGLALKCIARWPCFRFAVDLEKAAAQEATISCAKSNCDWQPMCEPGGFETDIPMIVNL